MEILNRSSMKEYGYINEGGYLHSRIIEKHQEQYLDGKVVKTRIVTEEEQISALTKAGWKPVEPIDNSKLKTDNGYIIRLVPYDDGECIKYRYERVYDVQKKRNEIQRLKDSLTSSDYKVIKCYEASLVGQELPYDITSLHTERQALRQQINQLEVQILTLG